MKYIIEYGPGQFATRLPNTTPSFQRQAAEDRRAAEKKFFATYEVVIPEEPKERLVDVFFTLREWSKGNSVVYSVCGNHAASWYLFQGAKFQTLHGFNHLKVAALVAKLELMNREWWPFLQRK